MKLINLKPQLTVVAVTACRECGFRYVFVCHVQKHLVTLHLMWRPLAPSVYPSPKFLSLLCLYLYFLGVSNCLPFFFRFPVLVTPVTSPIFPSVSSKDPWLGGLLSVSAQVLFPRPGQSHRPKNAPFIASRVWVSVSWVVGLVLSSLTSLLCLGTSSLCKKGGLWDKFSDFLRAVKLSLTCPHIWWINWQGQNFEFKYPPVGICRYSPVIVASDVRVIVLASLQITYCSFLGIFVCLFTCFKSGCSKISQWWYAVWVSLIHFPIKPFDLKNRWQCIL